MKTFQRFFQRLSRGKPRTRPLEPTAPPGIGEGPSAGGEPGFPSDDHDEVGVLLSQAREFMINNPIMVDRMEIHQIMGPTVLEKMLDYIIPGAEFDSSERDYPPRCHPGTRTLLLEQLRVYTRDHHSGTRILWLHGPAGVGKSAIMQTLAETIKEVEPQTFLCASLFFSRSNQRDEPKKVFSTLAYGLAVAHPVYRQYIGEKLAVDPGFLAKSIEEQFKHLFVNPFSNGYVKADSRGWVVLLDGLDECNGEREQCRILDVIRESAIRYGAILPFTWIIASRPEARVKPLFAQIREEVASFWELEVPVDTTNSRQDVELYLRTEFAKIWRSYPDIVPVLWPSEKDFLKLTTSSSGLFVFAATLASYVGEEDPVQRLEFIISLIDRHSKDHASSSSDPAPNGNPFQLLDLLYNKIMSSVPPHFLPVTKAILGYILLKGVAHNSKLSRHIDILPSLRGVCNILGIKQNTAYGALHGLHSVLNIPSQDDAADKPLTFIHASFSDYLTDNSRSQSYYINPNQELERIWRCYLRIAKQSIAGGRGNIALAWEASEGGHDRPLGVLRDSLYSLVQQKWLEILVDCCHDCTSCGSAYEYRLQLADSELLDIIEEFCPFLWSGALYIDIQDLERWFTEHAPAGIRQRLMLRKIDVPLPRGIWEFEDHEVDAEEMDPIQLNLMNLGPVRNKIKHVLARSRVYRHRQSGTTIAVLAKREADCWRVIGPVFGEASVPLTPSIVKFYRL